MTSFRFFLVNLICSNSFGGLRNTGPILQRFEHGRLVISKKTRVGRLERDSRLKDRQDDTSVFSIGSTKLKIALAVPRPEQFIIPSNKAARQKNEVETTSSAVEILLPPSNHVKKSS